MVVTHCTEPDWSMCRTVVLPPGPHPCFASDITEPSASGCATTDPSKPPPVTSTV